MSATLIPLKDCETKEQTPDFGILNPLIYTDPNTGIFYLAVCTPDDIGS